jgi:hypothetical protein
MQYGIALRSCGVNHVAHAEYKSQRSTPDLVEVEGVFDGNALQKRLKIALSSTQQ